MLTRRAILGAAAGLAIPTKAWADLMCVPLDMYGNERCEAGLAVPAIVALQRSNNWCWAASIQGIFSWHGYEVSQERIVEKVFGQAIDSRAGGPEIVYAVNGYWESDDGESFSAQADVLWDSAYFFGRSDAAAVAAQDLANRNPLIVGALGHATILTAIGYVRNAYGQGQVLSLTVRDPWPTSPRRRHLSGEEALRTTFLARVLVG